MRLFLASDETFLMISSRAELYILDDANDSLIMYVSAFILREFNTHLLCMSVDNFLVCIY